MPITTAAIITIIIITARPTVTTTITPDPSGPSSTTAFTTFARPSDAIPHPPQTTTTNFYSCEKHKVQQKLTCRLLFQQKEKNKTIVSFFLFPELF
jgi:hypothetical protein